VQRLQLPAGDNDLLNALSRSGGLPGVNAESQVRIVSPPLNNTVRNSQLSPFPRTGFSEASSDILGRATTVSIRQRVGARSSISPNDVRLNEGDIVVVAPKVTEVFYTSGLLGGGEFPIPRDRGLDVMEAVSIAGGTTSSNPQGNQTANELLVIRQRPDGAQFVILVDLQRAMSNPSERIQVRPGDVLMLRYSPAQRMRNIGIQTLQGLGLRQVIGR
jgi:protein involved in polysaccharide export with SLBB domain